MDDRRVKRYIDSLTYFEDIEGIELELIVSYLDNLTAKQLEELRKSHIHVHVEARVATKFILKHTGTYTKGRSHKNGIDQLSKNKFDDQRVLSRIKEIFGEHPYTKWLVVWKTQDAEVIIEAEKQFGIQVRRIRDLIKELTEKMEIKGSRDDIVRTLELVVLASREEKSLQKAIAKKIRKV